ncbi:MAG: hypothetical protein KJN70_12425, partial [Eudoraea sp.]|nr:hypothetical protein [Eudoraea sp.]
MSEINFLNILIGSLTVVIFAADRFHTPYINRYSTTASNFYTGAFLYSISYLGMYFLLCLYPEVINGITAGQFNNSEFSKLPKELVAALALTVLLPNTPGIKGFDQKFKEKIFKLINVPKEVRLIKGQLKDSRFRVPENQRDEVSRVLIKKGFDAKDIEFEDENNIGFKITKISYLIIAIKKWRLGDKYKKFSLDFTGKIDALIKTYEQQCPVYLGMTNVMEIDVSVVKETEARKIQNIVENNKNSCDEFSSLVLDEIYELLARALFSKWNNEKTRCEELKAVGFQMKSQPGYFSWDVMAGLFLAIFIIYFFRFTFSEIKVNAVLLTLLISLAYCTAAFWATYLKLNWDFAKRKDGQGRRYFYYLVAMACTFGTVAVFRIGVYGIEHQTMTEITDRFINHMPWQILSTGMALMLCI